MAFQPWRSVQLFYSSGNYTNTYLISDVKIRILCTNVRVTPIEHIFEESTYISRKFKVTNLGMPGNNFHVRM